MDKKNKNESNGLNNRTIIILIIAAAITFFAVSILSNRLKKATTKEVPYTEFMQMVNDGKVESVKVMATAIEIKVKPNLSDYSTMTVYKTVRIEDDSLVDRLYAANVPATMERFETTSTILSFLSFILPFIFFILMMNFLLKKMGGGGFMGVGKSNAKVYVQKETGITFKDVAGEDEAKESLTEIVDFLHNPEKYTKIGARLPKGGVGASRVRDLFKQAQEAAPAIIFIDEIDAIGKSRDSRMGGGNDEREQTLNQLLSEMDGFDSSKGLIVLGATNRPEILDPALLRPGRFDRRVIVERPDLKGRVDILKVHSKDVLMDDSVDLEAIGLATSGDVGSELANMINEAAILAVKKGRKAVKQKDLFEAVEVVLVGKEKKDRVMNQEERRIVSYHEVGHALISALQKNSEPVQKITIVPRTMGALGYVMYVPEEETYLKSKKELEDMLVSTLGGRAAEEIVFDSVTTGASNDIEKATSIARAMVTQYGMSEKFGLMGLARVENQYLSGQAILDCGDNTATEVDKEVMKILKKSYDEALRILRENKDVMDKLAEFLIEKETITGKEFMKILREIKGLPEKVEIKKAILV